MTDEPADGANILTVDDDRSVRDIVIAGLEGAGFRCTGAENPAQATGALRDGRFDLVLLDVGMPEKSGTEFLSELTLEHPNLAVVMLTGNADVSIAVQTLREGAKTRLCVSSSGGKVLISRQPAPTL